MIVKAIYLGTKPVPRIYHKGNIIYQGNVEFHVMEDGKLIILGALRANDLPDGLYLDCAPNVEWIYPVQSGNVLTIEQVYGAVQNGNILEVE
jgi:hypothetical protein